MWIICWGKQIWANEMAPSSDDRELYMEFGNRITSSQYPWSNKRCWWQKKRIKPKNMSSIQKEGSKENIEQSLVDLMVLQRFQLSRQNEQFRSSFPCNCGTSTEKFCLKGPVKVSDPSLWSDRLLPGLIQANLNILKDGYSRTAEKKQYGNNRNVEKTSNKKETEPTKRQWGFGSPVQQRRQEMDSGLIFQPSKVLGIGKEGAWGCDGSDTKFSNFRPPGESVVENQKGTAGWEWKGALLEPGRCNKTCCKKVKENKD